MEVFAQKYKNQPWKEVEPTGRWCLQDYFTYEKGVRTDMFIECQYTTRMLFIKKVHTYWYNEQHVHYRKTGSTQQCGEE